MTKRKKGVRLWFDFGIEPDEEEPEPISSGYYFPARPLVYAISIIIASIAMYLHLFQPALSDIAECIQVVI